MVVELWQSQASCSAATKRWGLGNPRPSAKVQTNQSKHTVVGSADVMPLLDQGLMLSVCCGGSL